MPLQSRVPWRPLLLAALIALTAVMGFMVRFQEPASTHVIPAEDPYTHMALVRNHLADGNLDPLVQSGALYPPGMHAVIAAAHAFTGIDLHALFLYGPVLFGVVSVVGIAVLLWRHVGPAAAFVGGMAAALAPELIFRTTMMAPTAIDLALLPFLFLAMLETVRGRLGWSIGLSVGLLFLVFAHPWLLIIIAPVTLGILLVGLLLARPHRVGHGPIHRIAPLGAALALAAVAVALLASLTICWDQCGLGFQNLGDSSSRLDRVAGLVAGASLLLAGTLAVMHLRWPGRDVALPRLPVAGSITLALAAAALLVAVTFPAIKNGMPVHVDLVRMFGWPILGLAAIGLVAVPLGRWRAGWIGAAIVTVTYPFVIYNPLDSPFWPHRTAAYLGIGLVILAGIGAAALLSTARWLAPRLAPTARHGAGIHRPLGRALGSVGLVLTAVVLPVGSVLAATPPTYETGWYRLYPECEFDVIRDTASGLDEGDVLITGDWRPKLVAAAFAPDAYDVWYSESFFTDPGHREETAVGLALDGRSVYVIADRHLALEHPDIDTGFLQGPEWRLVGEDCDEGLGRPRISVYVSEVQP